MQIDTRKMNLYAIAIALQQMHGQQFARTFLEDQGIDTLQARTLTAWIEHMYPRPDDPVFEEEFVHAIALLKAMCAYTLSQIQVPSPQVDEWPWSSTMH